MYMYKAFLDQSMAGQNAPLCPRKVELALLAVFTGMTLHSIPAVFVAFLVLGVIAAVPQLRIVHALVTALMWSAASVITCSRAIAPLVAISALRWTIAGLLGVFVAHLIFKSRSGFGFPSPIELLKRKRAEHMQAKQQKAAEKAVQEDSYAILGIEKTASAGEIDQRYRELVKQYHPDNVARLGPELKELANRKMAQINLAYETLK